MKTAIVTGVGPEDGLGGQLCLRFCRDHHVLVAGRTQDKLEAIAERIREEGGTILFTGASASLRGRRQFRRVQLFQGGIAHFCAGVGKCTRL